jgi:quinol monooxygenase YgiN
MDEYINVFTANDVAQAYVIKWALENADISVQIENEFLQNALGLLPMDGTTAPHVCVPQASLEQAQGIVESIISVPRKEAPEPQTEATGAAMILMHVTYDDFVEDEVQELSDEAIKLCEQHKGFVSARQFRGKDNNEHFVLMQWENEHAYLACRQSTSWLMLMPQWSALQEDGDATLEIKILTDL